MKPINFIIILTAISVTAFFSYFLWQDLKTGVKNQQQPKQASSKNSLAEAKPPKNQAMEPRTGLSNYEIMGMKVEVLRIGAGESAKKGDRVNVHYVGTLENGKKFDSSIDREDPFSFKLGENSVIKGWELGVLGMKLGEKRRLTIPPELGYGNQGAGGVIPPVSTLIFEIELLKIN